MNEAVAGEFQWGRVYIFDIWPPLKSVLDAAHSRSRHESVGSSPPAPRAPTPDCSIEGAIRNTDITFDQGGERVLLPQLMTMRSHLKTQLELEPDDSRR